MQGHHTSLGRVLTRVIAPVNGVAVRVNDERDKGDFSVTWLSISSLLKSQWTRRYPQRSGNRYAGVITLVARHPQSLWQTHKHSESLDAYEEHSHFAMQPDP